MIPGLLTIALAIATLCIWPPESWLGFLFASFLSPTEFNASSARFFLSFLDTPDKVKASSTLPNTVK